MVNVKTFYPTRILSASTVNDLLEWLETNFARGEKTLVVNLQNVLFMDSSGLGALVRAMKKARADKVRLVLCSLNGQARMLFEQAGMDTLFEIYTDMDEFYRKELVSSGETVNSEAKRDVSGLPKS